MGDRTIQMSREDVERSLRALAERLALLTGGEERLDNATADAVSFISDTVAGAGQYRDYYERNVRLAENGLHNAWAALRDGNFREISRFLASTAEYIENARSSWMLYLNASVEGGETAVDGGIALGVGAASGGIGGFLGLSLALHGAVGAALNVFSGDDEKPESSDGISAEAEEESEGEIGYEREPASQCIAPDQMTGKTASVATDQCRTQAPSNENEDEKIFRAIDGPVSGRDFQKKMETLIAESARAVEEWKPPVIEVSTPPVGGYKMRSRTELIAEAQRILGEWKKNPNAVHDYAAFLIDSEFLDASGGGAAEDHAAARFEWDQRVAVWKAAVLDGADVDFLMADFWQDYLQEYSEGAALLTDFLGKKRGKRKRNCEGQAKFVVSAHTASGAKLKKSEVLAVQFINVRSAGGRSRGKFTPHIQPIVYDRGTGGKVRAPLYDPHIFFYGFLKSQGAEPPVSDSDFLIPGVEVEPLFAGKSAESRIIDADLGPTNSNLVLPSPGEYFSDDSVPEYATSLLRYGAPATGGYGRSNKSDEQWRREVGDLDFTHTYPSNNPTFRTRALADEYNALPTVYAKREFLIHLMSKSLQMIFDTPEMKLGFQLFAKPSEARRQTSADIEDATVMLKRVANVVSHASMTLQSVFGTKKGYGWEEELAGMVGKLREKSRLVDLYIRARKHFAERILKHPAEFIAFLDRLSSERRHALLDLLNDLGGIRSLADLDVVYQAQKKIAEVLANPRLIGLKTKKPGYEPQHTKKPAGEDEPIEIEMGFLSDEKWAAADRAGQKGEKIKRAETAEKNRRMRYKISKNTMIDLILRSHYNESEIAKRWTPALSRRFLRLNRNGEYDGEFMSLLPDIVRARSKSKREVMLSFNCNELLEAEFGKLSEENKSIFKNTNCHLNVPPDIAEITKAIQKRRDAKKVKLAAGEGTRTQN